MNAYTAAHQAAVAQLTSPGAPFELGLYERYGHSFKYYKNAAANLRQAIDQGRQFGDAPFLQYQDQSLTFTEFFDAVDRLSRALLEQHSISPKDPIAIAMRNRPEWLIAFVAIINIGGVAVLLNSWGKGPELQQGLRDSQAKLLIADKERLDLADGRAIPVPTLSVDAQASEADAHWQQTLASHAPLTDHSIDISGEDPAVLMFTSGTSGTPKGALFPHLTLCQIMMNYEFIGAATYMTNTEAVTTQMSSGIRGNTLLAVPLFHVSGLLSQALMNLRFGRGIHIMYRWDAAEAIRLIERESITGLTGAPKMMMDLLTHADWTAEKGRTLQNTSAAGSATPEVLHNLILEKVPSCLSGGGWRLTESGGTGVAFTGAHAHERPGASGYQSPIVEFSFRDEAGRELPRGIPGEIWLRGITVIPRYSSGSDNSEFVDGWFRTGDVGYFSDEDLLYISGRVKEMIIRGGENIYPAEIEACLLEVSEVAEVGIVGVASEQWGEEVAAVVRFHEGASTTLDELATHCAARLAAYKQPVLWKVTAEPLPRNALQKLLKADIRERFFS